MKGALDFWKVFAQLIGSALVVGVLLVGPGFLLAEITGKVWVVFVWFVPAAIVFCSWATWGGDED
jgi:hypothetical protein